MAPPERNGAAETGELILGYAGGCSTCADLARRIEDRTGHRLKVRNLQDKQVAEWREKALGDNAPWAPTLFEVRGEGVQAWTGLRMAAVLGRALGPYDSWQVLQVLGEREGEAKSSLGRAGMSRGAFMKGVAGIALTASVFSAGVLLPSEEAYAQIPLGQEPASNVTDIQRRQIAQIVRGTSQFQSLVDLQAVEGARFSFANAYMRIYGSGRYAMVVVGSRGQTISVVAALRVNLAEGKLLYYMSEMFGHVNARDELKVTRFINGRVPATDHKTRCGDNYVITQDNRLWTHEEFENKVRTEWQEAQVSRTNRAGSYRYAARGAYDDCVNAGYVGCDNFADWAGAGTFALSLGLAPFSAGQSLAVGVASFAAISAAESACRSEIRLDCAEQTSVQPCKASPSYYC